MHTHKQGVLNVWVVFQWNSYGRPFLSQWMQWWTASVLEMASFACNNAMHWWTVLALQANSGVICNIILKIFKDCQTHLFSLLTIKQMFPLVLKECLLLSRKKYCHLPAKLAYGSSMDSLFIWKLCTSKIYYVYHCIHRFWIGLANKYNSRS